jgi:hypothetical protein
VTTQIPLASDLAPLVLSGRKTSTVRLGIRNYPLGPAKIVSGKLDIPIEITKIEFTKISQLNESVAKSEGYDSIDEFLLVLKRFYPGAESDRDVTVICFQKA